MILNKKSDKIAMNKFSAITLSEVLITLTIIGVVSTMTIPSLVANIERNRLDNLYRKSYTIMTDALKRATVDNGNVPIACYYHAVNPYGSAECVEYNAEGDCSKHTLVNGDPLPSDYRGNFQECYRFFESLKKHLSIAKHCPVGKAISDGCIVQYKGNDQVKLETNQLTNSMYSQYDANRDTASCGGWHSSRYATKEAVVLNDGMTLIPYSSSFNSVYPIIAVDVNGIKKPNKAGHDLYFFKVIGNTKGVTITPGGCGYSEIGGKSANDILLKY